MAQATIEWFSDDKGHGFIAPDEDGGDLFVHNSGIAKSGLQQLREESRGLLRGEPGLEGHAGEQRLKGIARRVIEQ